jgi:hypothetical protein
VSSPLLHAPVTPYFLALSCIQLQSCRSSNFRSRPTFNVISHE